MRVPNKLTIAGHNIKVVYRKKIMFNGNQAWGLYDDDKHIIYLTMGMEKTRKMEVFLHECIHAIEFIHNLKLSEGVVNILGIEIFAMLRNNRIRLY